MTGIEVPPDILVSLGAGKRPRIKIVLKGYSFVSTVGTMAGKSMISLSAAHRAAAGVTGGDTVEVAVALAHEPPEISLPDDLSSALQAAGLISRYDGVAPSRRKEWVRSIQEAKAPETRVRRVKKVLDALSET